MRKGKVLPALSREKLATAGLFTSTIVWGWGFIFQKFGVNAGLPPAAIGMGRNTLAALLLLAVFRKTIRTRLKKGQWKAGLLLGALLSAAQMLQSAGLATTTPGSSAFITSSYVVMVPLLYWLLTRNRLPGAVITACGLSLLGVGILSLHVSSGFAVNTGDALTLLCALLFAVHMVAVERFSKSMDPIVMAFLQFAWGAAFSSAAFLATDRQWGRFAGWDAWVTIGYLGLMSTGVGFTLQMVGQTYVPSTRAGVILSCEALFGAVFSVMAGYDTPSVRLVAGGLVLFVAVLLPDAWLRWKLRGRILPPRKAPPGAAGEAREEER